MNLSALVLKAAFIVVSALLCGGTAMAEDDPRPEDPASLLFEAPQWAAARSGATLSYRYIRKSANEALYGPSFEGLEGLVYTLAVSEEVPGQVTELTAKATRPDGVAALEETLVYEATE